MQVSAFCPVRPNVVWSIDFQFDQTDDAKTLKLLNIFDEFTRECLANAAGAAASGGHLRKGTAQSGRSGPV